MKVKMLICVLLISAGQCYSQSGSNKMKGWGLMSYSGNVGVGGFYRKQMRTLSNIVDRSEFPFLMGRFSLYTQSFVGHPNLLLLYVGGEFNPGTSKQNYTVSPDRSEALTLSKLNLRAILFNGKPMNLMARFDIGQNLINREYVTSLKTNTRQWGMKYQYKNKILPIDVSYFDRNMDQLELETGRTYRDRQTDLRATAKRSFTKLGDTNELRYTHYTYFRQDHNFNQTDNNYDKWSLYNTYFFDPLKKYMFRSYINTLNQSGILTQNRLQVFETVNFRLPYNFRFNGNYTYLNNKQEVQDFRQNRFDVGLEHQLFSSLRTGVFYEYYKTVHTAFDDVSTRAGISINYLKKIPANGTINLVYNYSRQNQNVKSNPDSIINVTNEEHVLADDQIVLLKRPYVNLATVIVKDINGSIIYQENFDYLLIERNEYVEIDRIPGGQIPNNAVILADYEAAQIGSYSFNANFHSLTVRLTLFERLLEVYYTYANQDYVNVESPNLVSLNYFTRNILGLRVQYKFINAGVERDVYESTIVPYRKMRYFLQMSGKASKKVMLSMNGDVTDLTLTEAETDQLYASAYGKVIYQYKPRIKFNLDLGYRKQLGEQIDLDLFTAKLECNTIFRNIYFKTGVEVYRRYYISEQIDYWGVYFQIDRKF